MLPIPIFVKAQDAQWEITQLSEGKWMALNLTVNPDQSDSDAAIDPQRSNRDSESRVEIAVPLELEKRLLEYFHPEKFKPENFDPAEEEEMQKELIRLIDVALLGGEEGKGVLPE